MKTIDCRGKQEGCV